MEQEQEDLGPITLDNYDTFDPIRQHGTSKFGTNVVASTMGNDHLDSIRKEFYKQEEISRQDPRNFQVRFILYSTYEGF